MPLVLISGDLPSAAVQYGSGNNSSSSRENTVKFHVEIELMNKTFGGRTDRDEEHKVPKALLISPYSECHFPQLC